MIRKFFFAGIATLGIVATGTAVFAQDPPDPEPVEKPCHAEGCDPGNTLDGYCCRVDVCWEL